MADTNVSYVSNPQKISDAARFLDFNNDKIDILLENIKTRSDSLARDWQGTTAEKYKELSGFMYKQGNEISGILRSFINDLDKVAGIYRTGEIKSQQIVGELPKEGIFLV